ncbi:hypothetical protein JX580_05910 [Thiomicrospira microaerophila]|uniref:hypothetical protein n=1 Tax=Thiomicrospira microaerophila TaxID=406020 RepID=UPI0020102C87|nr:hypothetical protein [Thiomicrospira microaerophila]UQB43392.1 hypothetical protein JX580_05910 [Thiomicrospira microaerophila]
MSHLSAHTLTAQDIQWIGERIYQNETGGKPEHLTFWSPAEEFPSLGLGHFIWLPSGLNLPFNATFPQMVAFVSKTHPTPDWMKQPHPPWQTKTEFDQAWSSAEMNELRIWLKATKEQQTQFIVQRFQQGALGLTERLDPQQAQAIQVKINRLMQNRYGQYALIDYVNFKGWGTDANERYQGEGWGLLQLLQAMPDSEEILDNKQLLQAFSQAGKQVLARRIELSPAARNEQRWMPGWAQRMDSYLP